MWLSKSRNLVKVESSLEVKWHSLWQMTQTFSPIKICFYTANPLEAKFTKSLWNLNESASPKKIKKTSKAVVNYTKTDPPWTIILRQKKKDQQPRGVKPGQREPDGTAWQRHHGQLFCRSNRKRLAMTPRTSTESQGGINSVTLK